MCKRWERCFKFQKFSREFYRQFIKKDKVNIYCGEYGCRDLRNNLLKYYNWMNLLTKIRIEVDKLFGYDNCNESLWKKYICVKFCREYLGNSQKRKDKYICGKLNKS